MKNIIKILTAFLVLATAVLASGNFLSTFTANSDGDVVTLRWTTIDESSLSTFEIERKGSEGTFTVIDEKEAKGSPSSYEYIDDNDLMKETGKNENKVQSDSRYFYRLKLVNNDNSYEYSNTVQVSHKTNSIRKTWGMIKEMFR